MKRLTILTLIGIATCLSSFGQGYFAFHDSSATAVIAAFSDSGVAGTCLVAILWSAHTNAVVPTLLGHGPGGASGTNEFAYWGGVIFDPNFHIGLMNGVAITAPTRTGLSLGTFNGGVVGIDGTAPNDVVAMYVIAWRLSDGIGGFGTSDVLGWSNPFLEALGGPSTPGLPVSAGMSGNFVVGGIPEPTAFALVELGLAAMLIFRRRK
jgi:hypothetical protein